jgi:ribosomal protein S18 acetylase RimI-like enzyme
MSVSISNINLQFEPHREIIMRLCKRNKFYENDVYVEIYRDLPPAIKNIVIETRGINEYNKCIEELFAGLESFGYFITIEEAGKKKVIGFIIYNIEKKMKKSYLLFTLIDKKYQKNRFGTKLLNKYIETIRENKLLCASVKIENKEVATFYKKFGFENLINSVECRYEVLHFIPPVYAT